MILHQEGEFFIANLFCEFKFHGMDMGLTTCSGSLAFGILMAAQVNHISVSGIAKGITAHIVVPICVVHHAVIVGVVHGKTGYRINVFTIAA
ncbi:hypothetical protein ES703_123028 [subsurface metagenome]